MAAAPTKLAAVMEAAELGFGAAEPEAAGATPELDVPLVEAVAFAAVTLALVTPSL